jgi:predicted aspartyl protease
MDGKYFIINYKFIIFNSKVVSEVLIDTGGSGYIFVDLKFAQKHVLPLKPLEIPRTLNVFDGSETVAGKVTHIALLDLKIGGHTSRYIPPTLI